MSNCFTFNTSVSCYQSSEIVYCDFCMTKLGYCIIIIKANKTHYFSTVFGKEL